MSSYTPSWSLDLAFGKKKTASPVVHSASPGLRSLCVESPDLLPGPFRGAEVRTDYNRFKRDVLLLEEDVRSVRYELGVPGLTNGV